jgi:arylsulfatase A-like enzyme
VVKPDLVDHTPVSSIDFYPTLMGITGAVMPPNSPSDGESLLPVLRQTGGLKRDTLYWHYPHYHPGGATPYSALREGDFRLVEFHEDNHVELYNLKNDIGETHDLSTEMAEKTTALRQKLSQWRKSVDAQMPVSNPEFDPEKDNAKIARGKH